MYMPESLLKIRHKNLVHFNHMARGGHFAAMEEPQILADDVFQFVKKLLALEAEESKARDEKKKEKSQKGNWTYRPFSL